MFRMVGAVPRLISLFLLASCVNASWFSKESKKNAPSLNQANVQDVQDSIDEWEGDAVVMFYAPWCPHCKQLRPVLEDVAADLWMGGTRQVSFAQFNCEGSMAHMQMCEDIGIKAYPTLVFFGNGNLPDTDPISRLVYGAKGTPFTNTAMFSGSLFGIAIRDWIRTVHAISKFNTHQKAFNTLLGFGKKKKIKRKIAQTAASANDHALQKENQRLKEQLSELQASLKAEKSPYEALKDYQTDGDPFETLHKMGYPDTMLAMRTCVGDVSMEYCEKLGELAKKEPFCAITDKCLEEGFASDECRPSSCPFAKDGCQLASVCLNNSVLADYQALVDAYIVKLKDSSSDKAAAEV